MNIFTLFDQKEIWVDRQGVSHSIREMDPRYAANVVRFLERHAVGIVDQYSLTMLNVPMPNEHTVAYVEVLASFDDELDRMFADPIGWLRKTPLLTALSARGQEVA